MDEKHIRRLPGWFYFFGFLLLLILFILSSIESADAQQPNPQACDSFLNSVLPEIQLAQLRYKAYNGYLFQGLSTHSQIPSDSSTLADMLYNSPDDQLDTWVDFLPDLDPNNFPCALEINVYTGINGVGYDVIARYQETARAPEPVICERIEAVGSQAVKRRGNRAGWSCE